MLGRRSHLKTKMASALKKKKVAALAVKSDVIRTKPSKESAEEPLDSKAIYCSFSFWPSPDLSAMDELGITIEPREKVGVLHLT